MGYIEDNLVHGEAIVFRTKLHWWVIVILVVNAVIFAALLSFLGTLLLSLGTTSTPSSTSVQTSMLSALCLLCGAPFVLLALIMGFLSYTSSEFGLTNRRIMIKTGIIRRHTLELNLGKVESFQVRETLWGRIVGYKTIILTGSGGTHQPFKYVAQAREFQKKVTELSTETHADYSYSVTRQSVPQPVQAVSVFDSFDLPAENTQQLLQNAARYIQQGNRQAAQQIVKDLIKSDPNNADVWYLAGYLSSSVEKKRQAYERALRINPRHQKALQALTNL